MTLIKHLSEQLRQKRLVLSTAESCTGGMIASAITDLSGSSEIFDRGFVTYSNKSKMEMLGVTQGTLNDHGAVSADCASEMVLGALQNSDADIAVSVTGIAGPGGASIDKPVGLVYIAVCSKGETPVIEECFFNGDRKEVRAQTMDKAFALLLETVFSV